LGDFVKENDLVTTCAHSFPKLSRSITIHRVEENVFERKAQTLFMKTDLDIALLVVEGADCASYAEFVDDDSISSCQKLLQMGHSKFGMVFVCWTFCI